jgi:nucleoside-diphosphate-sugar epimerase
MKIFVTGASGFIGGAIVRRLAATHEVLAMARSAQSVEKVAALGVQAVLCSLEDIQATHLQGCDVVVHCAAFVAPWGSWEDFYQGNVEGTRRVLMAAQTAGVKRFIHIGTEAALFRGQPMVDIDETYPYPAHSPFYYSETKKIAEKAVLEANLPGQFEALSLRPRLVWGPGDTSILPNLMEMVDKGAFRWIDGGRHLTSTVYIDNLVHGVACALTRGRGGEAYFIVDAEQSSMRDFLGQLLGAVGRQPRRQSVPGWFVRMAAWGLEGMYKLFRIRAKPPVTRFAAAIMSRPCTIRSDKALRELGYQAPVGVAAGMAAMRTHYGRGGGGPL